MKPLPESLQTLYFLQNHETDIVGLSRQVILPGQARQGKARHIPQCHLSLTEATAQEKKAMLAFMCVLK